MEKLCEITADIVTIEVTDKNSGQTLRRELPIDYLETAHCVRLMGENMSGQPCELVFYSQRGADKLRDCVGAGPDVDPCGGHSAGN